MNVKTTAPNILLEGPTTSVAAFLFSICLPSAKHLPDNAIKRNFEKLIQQLYKVEVDLDNLQARIPTRLFSDLAERASRTFNNPVIGLHFGLGHKNTIFQKLARDTMLTASSPMEYLDFQKRYQPLYSGAFEINQEIVHSEWKIQLIENDPNHTSYHLIDRALLTLLKTLKAYYQLSPKRIEFRHACPPNMENEYHRILNSPVRFNAPKTAVIYESSDAIKKVNPTKSLLQLSDLENILKRYTSSELHNPSTNTTFIKQVSFWTKRFLIRGEPSREQVAKQIGMSLRSMQRKLKEENTSFKELLNESRKSLCLDYLGDSSLRVTDISLLLGYSETTQFYRAFKRWMGISLSEYRKKHPNIPNDKNIKPLCNATTIT